MHKEEDTQHSSYDFQWWKAVFLIHIDTAWESRTLYVITEHLCAI